MYGPALFRKVPHAFYRESGEKRLSMSAGQAFP